MNNRKNSACDLSSSTLNSLTPVQHSIGTRAMMRTGFGAAGCDPKKTSSHSWHTSFTSRKVDIFQLKHLCRLVAKKKNVWCYSASWQWYLSLDVTGISLIAFDPLDLWDGQVTASRWKRMERNHADFFASSSELSKHLGSCRTCFQAALPLICDLISKRKNVTIQKVSKSQPHDCAELVCRNFTIKLRKLLLP